MNSRTSQLSKDTS